MRRRPPKLLLLPRADRSELEGLLRDGRIEQRVARRARIVLSMSDERTIVAELAEQVAQTRTGIWYVCRRYELHGLEAVYDAARSGRPSELSALQRVEIEQ